MKTAVIDIGSGSVRLLLDGVKTTTMTKLGEGLSNTGVLSPEPMARTVSAIKKLVLEARSAGAEIYAFGTEAVRSASNRSEFLSLVESECGISVEVISGAEEAEIAFLGACPTGSATVIDIGGASVEIVSGTDGVLSYVKSLPLGMVRLTDRASSSSDLIRALAVRGVQEYGDVKRVGTLIGVGGTFTSLAAMALGLTKYDAEKVHGYVLTKQAVEELTTRLNEADTPQNIGKLFPILPKMRCEIIKAGGNFVCELLTYLGEDRITVSEADNLDGYYRYKKLDLKA